METVSDRPPEREAAVTHYNPHGPELLTSCGVPLDEVPGDEVSKDRARVDCPGCTATLVDGQLVEPAVFDRRTVSLEVLTDELLALAAVEYVGADADLLTRAKVGIVGRIGGRADAVTDVDRDWHASSGADVLANLIRQAQGRAFNASAELLMPTPDVLAALAGQPEVRLLTEPVWVLAMDVRTGMLLVGELDGAETMEPVLRRGVCSPDDGCPNGEDCAVLVVMDGRPWSDAAPLIHLEDPRHLIPGADVGVRVHFRAYSRVQVRIPADQAVTR